MVLKYRSMSGVKYQLGTAEGRMVREGAAVVKDWEPGIEMTWASSLGCPPADL